jgi:hypothetical protein
MGTAMATENGNLSNPSHPTNRAWRRPLARRVAATFIICALIFMGLSQLIVPAVHEPNFRDIPPGMQRPLMALPQGETRQEKIYFDTKSGEKFETTPDVKPVPISPNDYKLHLDQ